MLINGLRQGHGESLGRGAAPLRDAAGRLRRREDGAVTLEAVIAFPPFVALLVFFFCLYRFAATEIALQSAAAETAKYAAHHWALAELATQAVPASWRQSLQDQLALLPADWVESGANLAGDAIAETMKPGVKEMLERFAEGPIRSDRIEIADLELPSSSNGYMFTIEAAYRADMPIPFFKKTWTIRVNASERAWLLQRGT